MHPETAILLIRWLERETRAVSEINDDGAFPSTAEARDAIERQVAAEQSLFAAMMGRLPTFGERCGLVFPRKNVVKAMN